MPMQTVTVAVNQDGRTANLTSPNGPAQQRVIQSALQKARISSLDVSLVEAHGTGTALGDPIEVAAQQAELGNNRNSKAPVVTGAAKSNTGHLEAAAGIVGLLKMLLTIELREGAPNLHLRHLNSHVCVTSYAVVFPTGVLSCIGQHTASVSSFGFGGTNAHAALEVVSQYDKCNHGCQRMICYKKTAFAWWDLLLIDKPQANSRAAHSHGIAGFEYYAPNLCCAATDLEELHNCAGRYTIGRGQMSIGFCDDTEDAVSMAMTVFGRLRSRCNLELRNIGRLEIGTESQVDRAKSIKSFLMSFFELDGLWDVEGADTYNACYGGTNALFNTVSVRTLSSK